MLGKPPAHDTHHTSWHAVHSETHTSCRQLCPKAVVCSHQAQVTLVDVHADGLQGWQVFGSANHGDLDMGWKADCGSDVHHAGIGQAEKYFGNGIVHASCA